MQFLVKSSPVTTLKTATLVVAVGEGRKLGATAAALDLAILKDKTSINKTTTAQLLKDDNRKKGTQAASRKEKPLPVISRFLG